VRLGLRTVLRELWATGAGRAGLLLFGLLVLAALYVTLTYPRDFGPRRWSNPAIWGDYPKAAPPAWINLLGPKRPEHRILEARSPTRSEGNRRVYALSFDFQSDQPPTFLSFSLADVTYQARPPTVEAVLIRPDGGRIPLYRTVISGPFVGENPPYRRHQDEALRAALDSEPGAIEATYDYLVRQAPDIAYDAVQRQLPLALFGRWVDGGFVTLKGAYRLEVTLSVDDPRDSVGLVRFVAGGAVYGLMGTDAQGRDLTQGLLFGLPIALLIGLAVATLSTLLGTALGLISGYAGGRTDLLIQRAADVVNNVPVLPLLIFMVFVLGARLWLILLVLVLFSWPGLTILVRSMVLSLRTSPEVEAARALGASRSRIIVHHIFPHIAPFIFATLIFSAPSAILAEAGLSFLGLGDPTLPTWGQILEQGFRTGAVYLGYWWWILPPGLLIVLTAITFMLISLGLEPIVNPRLRRGP
jgi:peptide/nickel transport system permease protein